MAGLKLNEEAWKKFIDDEADYSVDAGERPVSEFTGLLPSSERILKDGDPCGHPGCLNHVTHPCEGCGRTAGRKIEKGSNYED